MGEKGGLASMWDKRIQGMIERIREIGLLVTGLLALCVR